MNAEITEITDIPAALPIGEAENEREKLLEQAANEKIDADENDLLEADEDEEFEDVEELVKPSKKKLFLAFVGFVFCFMLLVALLSWFFGIGVFAATKTQAVDRTAKTDSSATTAPVTEEEKLKMALNLVADKNANATSDSSIADSSEYPMGDSSLNSPVDISSTKAADVTEPVIVPDIAVEPSRNTANNPSPSTSGGSNRTQSSVFSSEKQTSSNPEKANPVFSRPHQSREIASRGRSLFFGVERKENAAANLSPRFDNQTIIRNITDNSNKRAVAAIPFGTLLPIRFLGAVYTLRSSGGLVRMELTRSISGKNYSYPAGTVLVGTLRGNEYKRAFISVVGLIDTKTGGLVKFEGEVMGNDGASGVVGRRRQVKGAWSRVLGGMREAGSIALGAIGNRRSGGGTVIISDSASKASGVLTDELSGLVGDKKKSGEFIEIIAGTTGFVLVTDLPDEISNSRNFDQNSKSATGLSESELADLFSEGSPEKLRAALPRMTPAFRDLAEKVLAMEGR
ncbi:hypothetical protein BH10ACI1_BH10ACI1_15330 [soil metagenome]